MLEKIAIWRVLHVSLMIWLFLISSLVNGQSVAKIDSLKVAIANLEGKEKIDAMIEIAREYFNVRKDTLQAFSFMNLAQRAAIDKGDSARIIKTSRMKGVLLSKMERIDESLFEHLKVLPIARRHNSSLEIMYLTGTIGMNFAIKAKYDEGLTLLQESLILRKQNNDKEGLHVVLNNMGLLFYKMKSYKKALKYFQESVAIQKEIEDFSYFDHGLINCGMCHVYIGNYTEAFDLLNQGLNFCTDSCNLSAKSSGYYGLGVLFFRQKDLLKAKMNFLKSYSFSIKANHNRFQADNLLYLGKISFLLGNKQEGINQLLEAEKISKRYEYNELLISVYEELIAMFINNVDQLSLYQAKLIELRERVYSSEMIENLSRIQADYLERENTMRIEHQKEMITLDEQLIARQQLMSISIGVLILLFSLMLLMFYRNNRFKRKINKLLERKVQERSLELKLSIDELQQAYQERHERILETRSEVSACGALVKEICHQILMANHDEHTKECALLMSATTNHLVMETDKEIENDIFKGSLQAFAQV